MPSKPTRRRGAQPGNRNALTHGLYRRLFTSGNSRLLRRFPDFLSRFPLDQERLGVMELYIQFYDLLKQEQRRLETRQRGLELLRSEAADPLLFIRRSLKRRNITRDADSFRISSQKSTLNSSHNPLPDDPQEPPERPRSLWSGSNAASRRAAMSRLKSASRLRSLPDPFGPLSPLTDSQWDALAPLIPPDPPLSYYHGEPPVLIAANRWRFASRVPTDPSAAAEALDEYRRLIPESLLNGPPPPPSRAGRTPASPRLLLDLIFWRLALHRPWSALRHDHLPSWRTCQGYYCRLYRSGRLYTLLLALYDHLIDHTTLTPSLLVDRRLVTLDSQGRLHCNLKTPLGWEVQTSLLFLQLAHAEARRSLLSAASALRDNSNLHF